MNAPEKIAVLTPDPVIQVETWSSWRRFLNWPESVARRRMDDWRDFNVRLAQLDVRRPPLKPISLDRRSAGIFGTSIAHWDFLESIPAASIQGFKADKKSVYSRMFESGCGPLVASRQVDGFDCDICEVDGIAASKSSGRHFESVDEFGADFVAFKQVPVGSDGLRSMLAHHEVRITRGSGLDGFAVRCWDGRLFLLNAGGSHHFAGAAHISKGLRQRVAIRGKLKIYSLSAPAFSGLFDQYIALAAPAPLGSRIGRKFCRRYWPVLRAEGTSTHTARRF